MFKYFAAALLAALGLLLPSLAQAVTFDATITWSCACTNETGFHVYRKLGAAGTYALVGTTAPNVTTFTDPGLADSSTYFYQIGAFNTVNEVKGPEAAGTTGGSVNGVPGAPTIIFIFKP